jgi:hypothetical protein
VFWSKIWFFMVALVAAIAVTVALLLPRPAQRALIRGETDRLQTACGVIHILLADDARNRVELAGAFARAPEIVAALESAGLAESLDESRMKQVRGVGDAVMKAIQGNRKPDFAMLIDRRGRVVARVRLDEGEFGDIAIGRPLIDDALAGYLRDDLWAQNATMYFVSAAPVVKQGGYVGAVVLGHQVTNELAAKLVKSLAVDMGFHLGSEGIAGSRTIAFDHAEMQAAIAKLTGEPTGDCQVVRPIELRAGTEDYTAIAARLPGEAAARRAYYSVIIKRPDGLGLVGTLGAVKQSDLSPDSFPWIIVGGGFLIALGLGIGLMWLEADRPARRLTADAVRLAKGEIERMTEDAHRGRLGSVARSVNTHIDKLGREARSAKQDLDQLLGPAPDSGFGTIDLLATALPSLRPGGPPPAVAPPASEFRFQDLPIAPAAPPPPAVAMRKPAARAVTPPPFRVVAPPSAAAPSAAPPPPPRVSSPRVAQAPEPLSGRAPLSLDDDILGRSATEPAAPPMDAYFRQVFDQFVAVKRTCRESIAGLVYERFAEKLVKNREDLMSKTRCRDVRFTVYVKDGKAALKATPVKDEA